MPSHYPFVICWPLYRLSYFNACLLITPLLYVGHCIVCPTSMHVFWLRSRTDYTMAKRYQCGNQKAYIEVGQTIQWPTDTNVVIGICRRLYRLSYFNVCLLITTLVSVGHCIVCPTSMYAFLEQTIQWPTYNKVVIRRHTLKKDRRYSSQYITKG
jgi:hypothetical protein